jgi:hypothetical protein
MSSRPKGPVDRLVAGRIEFGTTVDLNIANPVTVAAMLQHKTARPSFASTTNVQPFSDETLLGVEVVVHSIRKRLGPDLSASCVDAPCIQHDVRDFPARPAR